MKMDSSIEISNRLQSLSVPARYSPDLFRGFECDITKIGTGLLGGKAESLSAVSQSIHAAAMRRPNIPPTVTVPHMHVIATDLFDAFMELNCLSGAELDRLSDAEIATRFAESTLPGRLLGKLGSLLERTRTPIVIRSSGLLETCLHHGGKTPYGARILANNNPDTLLRLRELERAVKAVWASQFFERGRVFLAQRGKSRRDEKMAIIIQDVFGRQIGNRFFPDLSGKILSPPRGKGYRSERTAVVEAEPGLTWTDGSGVSCSTDISDGGYWAVKLDAEHQADDLTSNHCCLVKEPALCLGCGPETIDATALLEVPVEEILSIAERIVGGRVEITFAVKGDSAPNKSAQTAVLKVSPVAGI